MKLPCGSVQEIILLEWLQMARGWVDGCLVRGAASSLELA